MAFLKKMLASVGIGGATVETVLNQEEYYAGGIIDGYVTVTGGSTKQKIDDLSLTVYATYISESDDTEYTHTAKIAKFVVAENISVDKEESFSYEFEFYLPEDTPATFDKTKVWIQTDLDLDNAVDANDRDYIHVYADPILEAVFESLEELGFDTNKEVCKKAEFKGSKYPFMQEFECVPTGGDYYGKLDEVEVYVLDINEERANFILQIDRRARGLASFISEELGTDESYVRLTITSDELDDVTNILAEVIDEYV